MLTLQQKYTLPEISFIAGQNQLFLFTLLREDGTPIKLNGARCQFSICEYAMRSSLPIVSVVGEISQGDDGFYVAKVEIKPLDTADLSGKFVYTFSIKRGDIEANIFQGIMNISENPDRQFLRM